MTVNEYLATYTLLTNLPTEIDYTVFKNRFVSTYGTRKIRGDVPIDNIAIIAQSVFNVNAALLTPLFTKNISPVLTWAETGENASTETGNNSGTNTETLTAENTANTSGANVTDSNTTTAEGATTSTTENTATSTGNSTNTTQNSVHAFNSAEMATPTDNSTTTSKADSTNANTAKTTTTDNSTSKNTAKTTATNNSTSNSSSATTAENTAKHDITRGGNYNKSGYNLADYERAFNAFVAPYDYLIKLIVNEICVTLFDLFDCGVC